MKDTVFVYSNCDTCKQATKWLDGRGNDCFPRDLVTNTPTVAELRDLWQRAGIDINKMFNTSGKSYQEGDFKSKLPSMSDDEKLKALSQDGLLIKRPILATSKGVCFGFDEAAWAKIL